MKNQPKSHYHCVYKLTYRLVLVTKNRKRCFTGNMLNRLRAIMSELCEKWEVRLVDFEGREDHVELVLDMHPNIVPSRFINNLKTVSSRLMRKEFSSHLAGYYEAPVLWTRAYCLLTSGGAQTETVRKYIERQERDD